MTGSPKAMDSQTRPIVAICIATFQRPKSLDRVLKSLEDLDTEGFQPHLVVVDNDASGAARETFQAHTNSMPFPATYVVEPKRGIPFARNRSVATARKLGAQFVLFTDDDVRVAPDWAKTSVEHALATSADVVVGQQLYEFDEAVPMHIRRAIEPPGTRTGGPMIPFSTANCLIRLSALAGIDGPFDTSFSLSGGSDKMLGARLKAQGKNIDFLTESVVYEQVPISRAKASWVLKRGYRNGINSMRIRCIMAGSPKGVFANGIQTLGHRVPTLGRWIWNLGLDADNRLVYLKGACAFIGMIHGLLTPRAVYNEYETIHGD